MSVEDSIENVHQVISKYVCGISEDSTENVIKNITAHPNTDARTDNLNLLKSELSQKVNASKPDNFLVQIENSASEETKSAILAFNGTVGQQLRDFTLLAGLTKYADGLLRSIKESSQDLSEEVALIKEISISASQISPISQLGTLLDALMALSTDEAFRSLKGAFYSILQNVLESLASTSTSHISVFWYFVESRAQCMKETVFSPEVTLDRIAVLSLCNSLTDRLYTRQENGRLDSYLKDSFNDTLQARVRVFLAGLLNVDDLTGLNKYFTIANRENKEPALPVVKTGDDQLLEDVLNFRKLLRDPYHYLKNPRQLATQADSVLKLHTYLIGEETKYLKLHPIKDVYAVKKPFSEAKRASLEKKYADVEFFPEQYWVSPFHERGSLEFKEARTGDQDRALKLFDSSKFRKLLILQIYLVSCFFTELQPARKVLLLKSIDALPTTKHITENSTPEVSVQKFLKMKRETVRLVKTWDNPWSFMLQHLSQSEEYWWGWIIYGKLKDGKPLLGAPALTDADTKAVEAKHAGLFPEKTKRYFNVYATPQLSRRMKTPTGLHLLADRESVPHDYSEKISELTKQIEIESDKARKSQLIEERTVFIWRQTRALRSENWMELDNGLNMSDLDNEEDRKVEEDKVEKPAETQKEASIELGGAKDEQEKAKETTKETSNEASKEASNKASDEASKEPLKKPSNEKPKETSNGAINGTVAGTLKEPSAQGQSIGEIAGDHVAESRVLQAAANHTSVGESAGQAVAETRKRERSPELEQVVGDESAAKKSKTVDSAV